ncbi:uncharacterized protein [Diabrotica undecimpunctata]|uniref:uncharacterized protein n=1 Tax=Diabrotica undecimpunctata TaxID=50387 RepID=UPI003B633BFE
MTDENTLKTTKTSLKGQLTRFFNFVNDVESGKTKKDQLACRLSVAKGLLSEFNTVIVQLLVLDLDETKSKEYESELDEFEKKFFDCISKADILINKHTFNQQADTVNTSYNSQLQASQDIRLPCIDLPKFSGASESGSSWLEFYDGFTSLIGNDPNLSNIKKFYYLKSCLTDSAAAVISSLEVTNDNYTIAWSILTDRFQNDKLIVHSHVRALFELSVIQKESPSQLRKLIDESGNTFEARALLDSGSQSNFITADLCKKLKLDKTCIKIPVSGINDKITHINHSVTTNIKSRVNAYQIESSFIVIDKITETLPTVNLNRNEFIVPENVTLADETFYKPGKIDILLGASIFYDLLCIGQIRLNRFLPILQKTMLGWVITGNVPFYSNKPTIRCNFTVNNIHDQLKQFWEIENIDNSKCLTKEEEACEKEYQTCFQKNQEGQIVVPLLVKDNIQNLGDSLQTALDRFSSLERKLIKNPEYKKLYTDFINEYQDLGHMALVTAEDLKYPSYYLPHHGVLKSDNTTTKLRVVFDGSAKTTTDLSLNDCLKVGPTIQSDLLSILIRFRFFNIVLAADIEKMYRQILVSENYQNYQRIIWRTNPSEEIQHFKLKTVTYGTASAPFLAIRSLTQVANEIEETDPDVAVVIRNGFYVDDLLYGCETAEQPKQLKGKLQETLSKSKFILRKWISNDKDIFSPGEQEQVGIEYFISSKEENKTLGITWQSGQDKLLFKIKCKDTERITKRSILSTISQIFDPLGLVGPYVIQAKIILQRLWKLNLKWDESVPAELHTCFVDFINQLTELNQISIPRHVTLFQGTYTELHGFCDASEAAYGACLYIKQSQLLIAKSRVAPLKVLTIPKLELCAAMILTDLVKKVRDSSGINFAKFTFWTDSAIVIQWINSESHVWKPFVSNRIAHIHKNSKANEWRHVPSKENPAYLISRGIDSKTLSTSSLWWHGHSGYQKVKTTGLYQNLNHTKATHLELVIDLTTEGFLNCLKRFISRRGKPLTISSDNATNFVGANNQLKVMYDLVQNSRTEINSFLTVESIKWQFIPARSPHYGGIWEAAVKSFKFHLKRIVGNHVFSVDNFGTLTTQIEACLNSRPLTPLSSNPADFQPLTPGHFLIFSPLTTFPEPDLRRISNLNTFQHMTQVLQHFWARWSTEYLTQLQSRSKWRTVSNQEVKIDQLVCLREDNLPPLQWKLGRISMVHRGRDNRLRVVTIKTNNGEVIRALSRLCILPTDI